MILKNIIIKYAPSWLIRLLRCYRPLRERFYAFLYSSGVRQDSFLLPYLKANASTVGSIVDSIKCPSIDLKWAIAFHSYRCGNGDQVIPLVWADGPAPGNYGDWLAPYIVTRFLSVNVEHVDEAAWRKKSHLIALGSILSVATKDSVVIGAGVASQRDYVNVDAYYISLRGPYSRNKLIEAGGPTVDSYGDIGFLLRRIYSPKVKPSDRPLLVRHIQHVNIDLPADVSAEYKEISIYRASPSDIEDFIDDVCSAPLVVTSAMHCFITCVSYGVPCILFTMGGVANRVPGDGVKYKDSLAGVDLPEPCMVDVSCKTKFVEIIKESVPYNFMVGDDALDRIEISLNSAKGFFE